MLLLACRVARVRALQAPLKKFGRLRALASTVAEPGTKVPVTLLSGFLGTGKTTLLRNLLEEASQDKDSKVGVVVNDVIYELVDGVKEVLEEAIEPVVEEHERGNVEVLQTFTLTLNTKDRKAGMVKKTQVAGGRVTVGEARTRHKARVLRGDEVLYDGKIVSLRHFKETVASVKKGSECGVILHNFGDAAEGDRISFYEEVPRKPHLYEELTEAELKLRAAQEDEG